MDEFPFKEGECILSRHSATSLVGLNDHRILVNGQSLGEIGLLLCSVDLITGKMLCGFLAELEGVHQYGARYFAFNLRWERLLRTINIPHPRYQTDVMVQVFPYAVRPEAIKIISVNLLTSCVLEYRFEDKYFEIINKPYFTVYDGSAPLDIRAHQLTQLKMAKAFDPVTV